MSKKKKSRIPRPMTRKQIGRAERDARLNRWIIIGAISIGVLVVAVVVFGYLSEVVFKGREPVATVAGESITTSDFQNHFRYRQAMVEQELSVTRAQQLQIDPTDTAADFYLQQLNQQIRELESLLTAEGALTLGDQVLQEMTQEVLIRQEAGNRGITVSDAEIDAEIESLFGFDPQAADAITGTATLTGTQGLTREEFEASYADYIDNVVEPSGLSEDDFRSMVEGSLLYNRVNESIGNQVPTTADQVQLLFFSFPTEEEALAVAERLDAGDTWEDIQAELEAQETGMSQTGDLDWRPQGYLTDLFGEEIAQAVFEAEIGSPTAPLVGSTERYYIFEVTGHEVRELDESALSYEQYSAFQSWLEEQQQYVERSEDWQDKIPTAQ